MIIHPFSVYGIPVTCINRAAIKYQVPATIIISVLSVERGRVGFAHTNPNGTLDYGPMQINSLWLPTLKKYGITWQQLEDNPCINVNVGTWILSQKIANSATLWRGVADYHSHAYRQNTLYRQKVLQAYSQLIRYLHHPTHTELKHIIIHPAHLSKTETLWMRRMQAVR